MNLIFLSSPLFVSLGAIIALFASILYVLDRRRASRQNHLRTLMSAFVTNNAMRSFSVIVDAREKPDSVPLLITRLEEQVYSHLEIILFTSAQADSKTIKELRRIQRQKKGSMAIRIVRQKPKSSELALIRRYSIGEGLLWLKPEDRLTNDFFTRMSFELLDESVDAISPRIAPAVDDTLRSATRAIHLVADQTLSTALNHRLSSARVIRRSAYLNDTISRSVNVEHSAITTANLPLNKMTVRIEVVIILLVLIVSVLSAIFLQYSWYIVAGTFIATMFLLMIVRVLAYPYSIWTRTTLILLIPLWPFATVTFAWLNFVQRQWSKLRKTRVKAA